MRAAAQVPDLGFWGTTSDGTLSAVSTSGCAVATCASTPRAPPTAAPPSTIAGLGPSPIAAAAAPTPAPICLVQCKRTFSLVEAHSLVRWMLWVLRTDAESSCGAASPQAHAARKSSRSEVRCAQAVGRQSKVAEADLLRNALLVCVEPQVQHSCGFDASDIRRWQTGGHLGEPVGPVLTLVVVNPIRAVLNALRVDGLELHHCRGGDTCMSA